MLDILIADDGDSWRDICREAFDIAGYDCEFVADAAGAIEKLKSGRIYKLVCINLQLKSHGNGRALLQRLDRQFPNIPVIVITGYFSGSIEEINEKVKRLQNRYPNVKGVVLKGTTSGTEDVFINALLGKIKYLLGTPQSSVSCLHLSDLHFRAKNYEQDKVLRHLLKNIEESNWKPDFIVVTGDIAYSAQPNEYKQAVIFFDDLLEQTELSKEQLFLVPGNHDINWNELSKYINSGIKNNLIDSRSVIEFLTDNSNQVRNTREEFFNKFNNYFYFYNDYFSDVEEKVFIPISKDNYYYVRAIETMAGKIVILGINSAWASALHFDFVEREANDKEYLLLGEPQVDEILKNAEEHDASVYIAIMHHPFSWLRNFDRKNVEEPIQKQCNIVMHGHLHETSFDTRITSGSNVVILGAGTSFENRDHKNCYSYIELNLSSGEGIVHLRRYTVERGGGWVPDTLSYPDSQDAKITFEIP
mgnify:CR=1 FL=1